MCIPIKAIPEPVLSTFKINHGFVSIEIVAQSRTLLFYKLADLPFSLLAYRLATYIYRLCGYNAP